MAEQTATPTPRAEPVHRVQGIDDDRPGEVILTVIRKVGRRESLLEVPITEAEAAKLVEQLGGALRRSAAAREAETSRLRRTVEQAHRG